MFGGQFSAGGNFLDIVVCTFSVLFFSSNMGYLPSEDDVQSAVLMCDETYKDVNEYDQVNGYVVQDVITVLDHANVKHKVVIADQGSTRIVAFRGSNG